MNEYNKITLAGDMLVQAVHNYHRSQKDSDYITSILLAGAVIDIIAPLLTELGMKSSQTSLAELSEAMVESSEASSHKKKAKWFYRRIYNSLKHAGAKETPASQDLTLCADLKNEAEFLISHAVGDYSNIPEPYITQEDINKKMSYDLLDILQSW